MLDSKFKKLRLHFGIQAPADWSAVDPAWILAQDGIGPVTLDHLRLYLAARDLTLKNDRTPEYWKEHLSHVRIGQTLGEEDTARMCPFTILIDSAEQSPFSFQGIKADGTFLDDFGDRVHADLVVPTEWRSLGRYPNSLGDYSVDGFAGQCHVERKSVADCCSTILGWDKNGEGVTRREQFESELANLSAIDAGLVVVEGTLQSVLESPRANGKKSVQENAKIVHRTIVSWVQQFSVPWLFCDSRRFAEITTFRFLERYWRHATQDRKETERVMATL